MATFILTAIIFGLVIAGMAVGVIFQDKPIKGSCGGLNNIGLGGKCDICGSDTTKCEDETDTTLKNGSVTDTSMAYDAVKKS